MRKADKNILNYMKSMLEMRNNSNLRTRPGYYYSSIEDFLKKEGTFYKSQKLTKSELEYVSKAIRDLYFTPKVKQCFFNSQMLVLSDRENKLVYSEGLGFCGLIPMLHGWVTINGKVIDLTWKTNGNKGEYVIGKLPKDYAYCGVKIDKGKMGKKLYKAGKSISFIDNWEEGFPLLKNKFNGRCLMP